MEYLPISKKSCHFRIVIQLLIKLWGIELDIILYYSRNKSFPKLHFSHTKFFLPISYLPPTVTCCPLFQMYLYSYFALHRSTFNALSTFKISAITISKQALTITKYCISQHFVLFALISQSLLLQSPVLPVPASYGPRFLRQIKTFVIF